MLILLGTTLTTSFFDSLNPSAIAQQMLLQAMVKKKRHIWYFIGGIGLANLLMGIAVYCGIAGWVSGLLSALTAAHPLLVYGSELGIGAVCFIIGLLLIRRTRRAAIDSAVDAKAPARLNPLSLFMLGAAFCFVELTSALPYFGFLAVLAGYRLPFIGALPFMLLYDFMYMLPLILLYFGYNRLQGTALIQKLERVMAKVSAYVLPVAVSVLSAALIYTGTVSLLGM